MVVFPSIHFGFISGTKKMMNAPFTKTHFKKLLKNISSKINPQNVVPGWKMGSKLIVLRLETNLTFILFCVLLCSRVFDIFQGLHVACNLSTATTRFQRALTGYLKALILLLQKSLCCKIVLIKQFCNTLLPGLSSDSSKLMAGGKVSPIS